MKAASSVLQVVAGISGLILVALGVFLWFGRAYQFLPLHIGLGVVLVLALWVEATLAARAGASRGLVAFAFAWGLVMPAFGMAQANLLPGSFHWVIRALHLAVGIVAMGLVGGLGKQVRRGAAAAGGGAGNVMEGRAPAGGA